MTISSCTKCGSRIITYTGSNGSNQYYKCKQCNHCFYIVPISKVV